MPPDDVKALFCWLSNQLEITEELSERLRRPARLLFLLEKCFFFFSSRLAAQPFSRSRDLLPETLEG